MWESGVWSRISERGGKRGKLVLGVFPAFPGAAMPPRFTTVRGKSKRLTRHAQALTAVDRLRPLVTSAARPLLTHGTGAMEKNIETILGRRFKRWGMRWTRRGAHQLLKLRLWIARCGSVWLEALHSPPPPLTKA
jgi:hypothetical protein